MALDSDQSNGLLFIDVEARVPIPVVKEESPSSLDEELSSIKDKGKLHCTECDRFSCHSADRMTRHVRKVHRGQNPFQCAMCDYSTYNTVCFTEHVNIHKGIKPYQCKHCPYRSVSKKYIKMHETKHGTCNLCGFIAKNRPQLRRHKKNEHNCKEKEDKSQKYSCNNCDIHYDTKNSLKQHKKNHKKCPYCNETYIATVLNVHLAKKHGVELQPMKRAVKFRFSCKQCDWQSNYLQKILLHMIHHPEQDLDGSIDITPLVKAGILSKSDSDC